MIALIALATQVMIQAPAIAVERLDETSVLLSLEADPASSVAEMQERALPAGRQACQPYRAVLGSFRFLNEGGKTRFEQEMLCFSIGHWSGGVTKGGAALEPTRTDQQMVLFASYSYFSAKDAKRYARAYANLSDQMKSRVPLADWSRAAAGFDAEAGPVRGRRVVEITWYRDPQDAPEPGLYVAADFSAEFEQAEFVCGYLMWRIGPEGGMQLVREEQNIAPKRPSGRPIASIDRDPLRARMGCKD